MSAEYPAGTVAVATVRGVENVRVMLDSEGDWHTAEIEPYGDWFHDSEHVTDVRPLVVLDLDNPAEFVSDLRNGLGGPRYSDMADAVEAQTKPPRIAEPGQFGVVEASNGTNVERRKWVRQGDQWWIGSSWTTWRNLTDPTLVREGLS